MSELSNDSQTSGSEPMASTPASSKAVTKQSIQDVHLIICTLRSAHQNQTRLITLADQKANALIGALALIFTILFANTQQILTLPLISRIAFLGFLIAEIIGIAYALLVIFPKNIKMKKCNTPEEVSNPLFFGAYTQFEEDEYVPYLSEQLSTGDSAHQLLIKDFYQVGTVLKCKYGLLRRAYIMAVSGFIILLLGLAAGLLILTITGL